MIVSGLPTVGYALKVDGRLKTEFETKEGARTGAAELKNAFRCCGLKSMTLRRRPKKKSIFHENECGLIWQPTSD
jgi:hypothetical protein